MPKDNEEKVEIYRGGEVVTSLIGSFGHGLRETRLTAALGYLAAHSPVEFCKFFGFSGIPQKISVERYHGSDRSDIEVLTSDGLAVIEAKVGFVDPKEQARKYPGKWHVYITGYHPNKESLKGGAQYFTWESLRPLLDALLKSRSPKTKFIAQEFITFLGDNNMIKTSAWVEIYARELNDRPTVDMFLDGRVYGCYYEARSQLAAASYFAPHFGNKVAREYKRVSRGISHVARIEEVVIVESFKGLAAEAVRIRGKKWFEKNKHFLDPAKKWEWGSDIRRSFAFVEEPEHAFTPPAKKELLQEGKGWLSRRVFTFSELLAARST